MIPKKYYLETNALYSINKIDVGHLSNSFTSVLSLFELISGMRKDKFAKRKAILNSVRYHKLHVDWRMPEEMIFSSFNALRPLEFKDFRQEAILRLISLVSKSESFEDLVAADKKDNPKMGLDYFKNLDSKYNLTFVTATDNGNKELKGAFENPDPEPLILNEKSYNFNSHQDLRHLFETEKLLNRAMTIMSFAGSFLNKVVVEELITEEIIYNSYNGYVDKFIDAYSARTSHYTLERTTPQINDFTDLMHLLYLSDLKDAKIVSDDNLYKTVCPELLVDINSLTNRI